MAAMMKKRKPDVNDKKSLRNDRSRDAEDEDRVDETVIQVDFEGRNPIDSDFHGIKQLLSQLFLKSDINLGELTNHIIHQQFIGSVLKQSEVEDETDEEDSDPNEVFGISTVIDLGEKQGIECITQLRSLLLKLSKEYGSTDVVLFVNNILSDKNKAPALLINERFVNIPSQVAVPLLKSLRSELLTAIKKRMVSNFSYLVLISKMYKMDLNNGKKSRKEIAETIWSNPEEEIIEQEAEVKFEFSVKDEADSGLVGNWEENDNELIPMRRVLFISFDKFNDIIQKVEENIPA